MEVTKALKKMVGARSSLIMETFFYGPLACRTDLIEDPTASKLWTDMKNIGYNPEWVESVNLDELKARICECVMHNAYGHSWRIAGLDPKIANIACDRALWSIMKESGFALPDDVNYDPSDKGMSMEQIYQKIFKKPPPSQNPQPGQGGGAAPQGQSKPQPQQGKGKPDPQQPPPSPQQQQQQKPDPGSAGEVRQAPVQDQAKLRDEWKIAVLQAAHAAKQRGQLPAGLEQLVEAIAHPAIDWKAALRKFLEQVARNDYNWRRPNKRYISRGLYLPQVWSQEMGPVGVLWDASGSRDTAKARAECAAEITEIIQEVRPERTHVWYVDTKIHREDIFERGDPIKFNSIGGGGTDFRSFFKHLETEQIELACLIGITDLEARFPEEPPAMPVLWAASTDEPAPWGEILRINQGR